VAFWKAAFPTVIANFVTPIPGNQDGDDFIGVGQCQGGSCGDGFCGRCHHDDGTANGSKTAFCEPSKEIPEFVNWTDESSANFRSCRRSFLCRLCSLTEDMTSSIGEEFSINKSLLDGNIRDLHKRKLLEGRRLKPPVTRMSCFPGATRTYCSSKGILYSCEKTDFDEFFALGNARDDVDADKAYYIAEMLRLHCDCANCPASSFCGLCSGQVTVSKDDPGRLDGFALRKKCQKIAAESNLAVRLREYTEIMEANPNVLDWIYDQEHSSDDDWLNHVQVITTQPKRVGLPVEELEEFV
jgi:hypothetical protein